MITRRRMLMQLAAAASMAAMTSCRTWLGTGHNPAFSASDDAFLEELQRASFLFFRECAHPKTGLAKDRD